jgi:hypothetical protein
VIEVPNERILKPSQSTIAIRWVQFASGVEMFRKRLVHRSKVVLLLGEFHLKALVLLFKSSLFLFELGDLIEGLLMVTLCGLAILLFSKLVFGTGKERIRKILEIFLSFEIGSFWAMVGVLRNFVFGD